MFTLDVFKKLDASFSVVSLRGDGGRITTICSYDKLCDSGMLFIKNKKFYKKSFGQLSKYQAVDRIGVVIQKSFFDTISGGEEFGLFKQLNFLATVKSVDVAICGFSKLFFDEHEKIGNDVVDGRTTGTAKVQSSSVIAPHVFLGEGVEIGANVMVHSGCVILSGSRIGEGTVLYPNVTVYRKVVIGKNCRIHANTSIGSDGFGYIFHKGQHLKRWHFGGVIIEDSVEVGSNTSVDQGTFSPTIIGEGTKIDNQVQIAHNCRIGKGTIICGLAGLAGSVKLGEHVVVGGGANISHDLEIGNYAQIGGTSGVTCNVPEKAIYTGYPARPIKEFLKSQATLNRFSKKKKSMK